MELQKPVSLRFNFYSVYIFFYLYFILGSGKTLAFLLPMFRHILDQPPLEETDGPIAVIMTPTRELCMQIGKDIKKFTKSLNLYAVCVYGGTGISEQIAELKRGMAN